MSTVAITGINGFIAVHVALRFLNEGHIVRGSVRSISSAEKVKANPVWKEWFEKGRIQVVVVPDLTGDLTELLDGVEYVMHLAAPVTLNVKSYEEFRAPTIEGNLSVLDQATIFKTIKAISLMSSMAGHFNPVPNDQQLGAVYTEDSLFPYDEETARNFDPSNPFANVIWYCAAKKYAEFAVKDWLKEHKPSFSVASLAPPMTYGPSLQFSSIEEFKGGISGSQPGWLSLIKGKDAEVKQPEATTYADVRDVAEAFYQAAIRGKDGIYVIASDTYTYQMFANEFRRQRPDLDAFFPLGNPSEPTPTEQNFWTIDTSKSVRELGLKYHTLPETVKATLEYYEKIGVFNEEPGSWAKDA
ncbi:hypothetical protein I302_105657 [Kwoniella bestiolae CBS 10118]|uniref:NAD-dependent epimerase/dehydratase domain-containing protein n=1 Tax=Kwoniella bestiolae CBS 10118 TaxID=1296100 RepID=A0A1B9G1S4_9TREE|nr:hypothetical protein I302_04775 [Kwoniella bestiolae CBS 10118]OCF24965.1 hypothetical protein I302_04775 [Kwoniella bestiolae CBS 10118]